MRMLDKHFSRPLGTLTVDHFRCRTRGLVGHVRVSANMRTLAANIDKLIATEIKKAKAKKSSPKKGPTK